MDIFSETVPADVPLFAGWPIWIVLILILAGTAATIVINNFFFAWLRRCWPGLVRPRTTLAILGLCIAFVAIILAVTPRSELRNMLPQPAAPQQPVAPVLYSQPLSR